MPPNKSLSHAAYLLGTLLIILPLVDLTMSVWPPRISDERWRFGAVGSLSNVLLVPLIGLLIVLAVAVWQDHRRVQRIVGSVCIVLAALLAVLDVLFILDYFQARTTVTPRYQQAIGIASTTAFIKNVLTILTLILLGRSGFAGPKPIANQKTAKRPTAPDPLLARVPGAGAAE